MTVTVDIDAIRQQIRDKAQAVAESAADIAVESFKAVAPVGQTGNLRDAIEAEVTETADGFFTAKFRVGVDYASFTDTGHAEFVMEGSPVLSFDTPDNWSFDGPPRDRLAFRSVVIPAYEGTNWFEQPMPEVWEAAVAEATANV